MPTVPQSKPIVKQNTSRAIVAVVGVVLCNILRKHFGATFTPEIEALINDEVVPALVTLGGALAVYFRQKVQAGVPMQTIVSDIVEGRADLSGQTVSLDQLQGDGKVYDLATGQPVQAAPNSIAGKTAGQIAEEKEAAAKAAKAG